MDRAYIYQSISTSLQVAELPVLGQLIFERMFPHADFQGRLPGHPRKVKATVIPMIDASADEVADQLQKMHDLELIIWYEAGGEKHTQLVSWWKFQPRRFAHPSKLPAPEGWRDRLRYHDPVTHKLVEVNWEGKPERVKKSTEEDAGRDPYIGGLHREPIQGAYEGSEIHPYASALALENQTPLSESSDSDLSKSSGNGKGPGEVQAFFDSWNLEAKTLPKATRLTEGRKRKIQARLRERSLEEWVEVFRQMGRSSFLRGESGNGSFRADLDWIIANEGNALKVVEGRYDDREKRPVSAEKSGYVDTQGRPLEKVQ